MQEQQGSYGPFSLQDGSVIALQAANGLLVSRINYGGVNGVNHLEVAKPQMDIFCHLRVIAFGDGSNAFQAENGHFFRVVKKQATSTLALGNGMVLSREKKMLSLVMTEHCPLEQAARFSPMKMRSGQVVFRAENGRYLGYKQAYTITLNGTRHPLLLVKPDEDAKTHISFGLIVLEEPPLDKASFAAE